MDLSKTMNFGGYGSRLVWTLVWGGRRCLGCVYLFVSERAHLWLPRSCSAGWIFGNKLSLSITCPATTVCLLKKIRYRLSSSKLFHGESGGMYRWSWVTRITCILLMFRPGVNVHKVKEKERKKAGGWILTWKCSSNYVLLLILTDI